MNGNKIDEVAKLLDAESSEVVDSKLKRIMKEITFPFVQMAVFGLSSLLGTTFGYWENSNPTGYPYTGIPRVFTLGTLSIIGVNSGNLVFVSKTNKRFEIDKIQAAIIFMVNLLLSFISFFLLYNFIKNDNMGVCMTSVVKYGVYSEEENIKNLFFELNKH